MLWGRGVEWVGTRMVVCNMKKYGDAKNGSKDREYSLK